MELIQIAEHNQRNIMWKNYAAHDVPQGVYDEHDSFELDFRFKRIIEPEIALQKISDWHRRLEESLRKFSPELPPTLLFVCNDYEGLREFDEFCADFRGILALPEHYEAELFISRCFSQIRTPGFSASFRKIPLSIYAQVYKAHREALNCEKTGVQFAELRH